MSNEDWETIKVGDTVTWGGRVHNGEVVYMTDCKAVLAMEHERDSLTVVQRDWLVKVPPPCSHYWKRSSKLVEMFDQFFGPAGEVGDSVFDRPDVNYCPFCGTTRAEATS